MVSNTVIPHNLQPLPASDPSLCYSKERTDSFIQHQPGPAQFCGVHVSNHYSENIKEFCT